MPFYAHTPTGRSEGRPAGPKDDWEPLARHLEEVAACAREFGARLLPGDAAALHAEALGWLHDAGKYDPDFQLYLEGNGGRVEHSTAGAVLAMERYGARAMGLLLAYAVAGHHAGLPDGGDGHDATLLRRCRRPGAADAARPGFEAEAAHRLPAALPPLSAPVPDTFTLGLLVRMLFSCLTDADALMTERFVAPDRAAERGRGPSIATLADRLRDHLATFAAGREPTPVDPLRAEVLARCRAAATLPPGLFSLTVPTGGGKTLSSLAFALEHAREHRLRRVVYVIPYLSIIEQTAQVFRDAFEGIEGAVVEHHGAYDAPRDDAGQEKDRDEPVGPDRHKLAAENWDAPLVVTTAVQFFESLFAARPSRCRKLHNLAGAVIVLDEAQTLPVHHLRPCLAALQALAGTFGASIVLCTATQPALGKDRPLPFGLEGVREIMPDPQSLHDRMRRTALRRVGPLDDEALAERIAATDRVLCIVETRGHAADLWHRLSEADTPGLFHLSAAMCAEHRSQVLARIRAVPRGSPCRVVSTQLVEAGVDLDFPRVMRAMAGLDSLVQSAGRCNRGGRDAMGIVEAFETGRSLTLSDLARRRAVTMRLLARLGPDEDPFGPETMSAYFAELFEIEAARGEAATDRAGAWTPFKGTPPTHMPFRTVAEAFKLIDDDQISVITPRSPEAEDWAARLAHDPFPGPLARKLQRHTVSLPGRRVASLIAAGTVRLVGTERQFPVLADPNAYHSVLGLIGRDPRERSELENIA